KAGGAPNQLDPIPVELVTDQIPLVPHHGVRHGHEVGDGDVSLDGVVRPEQPLLLGPRKVEHRFAEGLRGNRPRIDLGPPEDGVLFDDRHLLAELGGLNGPLLTRGAGTDHYAVVMGRTHGLNRVDEEREGNGGYRPPAAGVSTPIGRCYPNSTDAASRQAADGGKTRAKLWAGPVVA